MRTDQKQNTVNAILFFLTAALLIIAAIIFIRCTPYGVGLVSDSVLYINGACSIAQGNGYFRESGGGSLKPITNFPPLYSLILSLPIRCGMDGLRAAWWVSLIFFVLNELLVVLLVMESCGNPWFGLLGGALFLTLRPWLYFQFYAMTEPVYFCCTLLAFYFFIRAYRKGEVFTWFCCGIACGGAFLSRYIGIVSLCAVFGALLLIVKQKKGHSLTALFLGALPPIGWWLIRNQRVSGNASNRQILSHWVSVDDLKHGVLILWRWIYPERYAKLEQPAPWMNWTVVAFLAFSLLFLIILWITSAQQNSKVGETDLMVWTYLLFIIGYFAAVILTISLFDASVNIEDRILFPAFVIMLLALLTTVGGAFDSYLRAAALLGILCIFLLGFFFAKDTLERLPEMAEAGYGWGWEGWKTSPAMNIIRGLPKEKIVYSNQPEAVSLWAERGAYALLDPIDPSSEQRRPGYDETLLEIRRQVSTGEAVLVFFGINDWLGDSGENWVSELCADLPFIYQDSSEWVVGIE